MLLFPSWTSSSSSSSSSVSLSAVVLRPMIVMIMSWLPASSSRDKHVGKWAIEERGASAVVVVDVGCSLITESYVNELKV